MPTNAMTVATAKASWFDSWAMMPAVIGATIIAALATRLSQAIADVAERSRRTTWV